MINKKSKKFIFVIAARIIGVAISFLMNVIITRWISVDDAGVFFTSFSLIMLWGLIGTSGFCDAILRIRPQLISSGNHNRADSLALFGILAISIISCAIAILIFLYLDSHTNILRVQDIIYVCSAIPIVSLIQYTGYFFQASGKSLLSVIIINISYPLIFSLLTLGFVALNSSVVANDLVRIFFISVTISLIICIVLWKKYIFTSRMIFIYLRRLNYKYITNILFSFLLILICNTIIQWITPIISRFYVSNSDIALVTVCLRVGLVISFFLISLNVVFAPTFSTLYAEKRFDELTLTVRQTTRLVVVLSLPGIILLLVFPHYILSLFGSEYMQASTILRIICIGQLVNVLTGSVAFLLTMTGYEKIFRNIIIINAFIMIINLNVFGGCFGVKGITIATALSVVIQNVIAAYYVKRKLNINIIDYFYLK